MRKSITTDFITLFGRKPNNSVIQYKIRQLYIILKSFGKYFSLPSES